MWVNTIFSMSLRINPTFRYQVDGRDNNYYVDITNGTGATVGPINVTVTYPSGITFVAATVPGGTTYNSGSNVWSIPTITNGQTLELIVQFTHNLNANKGLTIVGSAAITSGTGLGTSASTNISIFSPFVNWNAITINGGTTVTRVSTDPAYVQDFTSQGLNMSISFRRVLNGGTAGGSSTLLIENQGAFGQILQLQQVDVTPYNEGGTLTLTPTEYSEIILDFSINGNTSGYPNPRFSFLDVDGDVNWRDGLIVFGTAPGGGMVNPVISFPTIGNYTTYSSTPPIFSSNNGPVATLDPRGCPSVSFSGNITTITLRYYNQTPTAESSQVVRMSAVFRDGSPKANPDGIIMCENGSTIIDVLANDVPLNFPFVPSSVSIIAGPLYGVATANPSTGYINYTPASFFDGIDTLTYYVRDTLSAFDTALVSITVLDGPTANPETYTIYSTISTIIDVLSNDLPGACPLVSSSLTIIDAPLHGTASVNLDGTINYASNFGYSGIDSLEYKVCNECSCCDSAVVTLQIQGIILPSAVDDLAISYNQQPIIIPVLSNDVVGSFPFNLSTLTITSLPAVGTAIANGNGTITYIPPIGFTGPVTFVYQICDTQNFCTSATVTVLGQCAYAIFINC